MRHSAAGVCPANNPELARHLAFRDYLRTHPGQARAYAKLKRSLAEPFRTTGTHTATARTTFIKETLAATVGPLR